MKIETVVITPELASKWLALNTKNRPVRKNTVHKYAGDMLEGRWKLNGETIKLNGDRLIDGQHRLQACVEAKTPFVSVVVHDVDSDVFDTVDRGMIRSFGQILNIAGTKNAHNVAAAARILWCLETGNSAAGGGGDATTGVLEEVMARYPELEEIASKSRGLSMANKLIPSGIITALWVVFSRKNEVLAESFFRDLNDGSNIFQPVGKLRQRLISDRMAKKKTLSREELLVITIKAWNAVRENKQVGVLRWIKTEDKQEQRPLIQ